VGELKPIVSRVTPAQNGEMKISSVDEKAHENGMHVGQQLKVCYLTPSASSKKETVGIASASNAIGSSTKDMSRDEGLASASPPVMIGVALDLAKGCRAHRRS